MNTEIADVAGINPADARPILPSGIKGSGQPNKDYNRVKPMTKKSAEVAADSEQLKNKIARAVEYFEKFARDFQFDLQFSVDDNSKSIVIKVLEKGTHRIIKQIPPDEILRLRQRISDLLGALYDSRM